MRRFLVLGVLVFSGVLGFGLPSPAAAVTRYVANNGLDTPVCGPLAAPCRSITQGIAVQANRVTAFGTGMWVSVAADRSTVTGNIVSDGTVGIFLTIPVRITNETGK